MDDEIDKLKDVHFLYFKYLSRCADITACENILRDKLFKKNPTLFYDKLEKTLSHSTENISVELMKKYLNTFNSQDIIYNYIANIVEMYVLNLYYLPNSHDITLFRYYLKETDNVSALKLCKDYMEDLDDFKYLEKCRKKFNELSNKNFSKNSAISIHYYGPVGLTGYSKICKDLVSSLLETGKVNIKFTNIQFQNYDLNNTNDSDKLLSSLSKNNITKYNYVVLHSTPDLWPPIYKLEKKKNKNVIIYGITVWESDNIPIKWIPYLNYVDKISSPSEFSALSFRKIHNLDVDIIHHPVYTPVLSDKETDLCPIKNIRDKYDYIFYNISEFTNRKGIVETIIAYKQFTSFYPSSRTLLYIKTFGDISEEEANKFINKDDNIILDYKKVSDEYIKCIHTCCDCYVSLCKAEGHGIGACHAALHGNHVIITGHGGQLDYLKDVDFVNSTKEPAIFCTEFSYKHNKCKFLPHCIFFDGFIPSQQSWAKPDISDCVNKLSNAYIIHKKGKKTTIEHIKDNFNLKSVGNKLLSSIISTKIRKQFCNIFKTMTNNDFIPQNNLLKNNYISVKKRILIVGSYGYGNVGDDSYGEVFKLFFKEKNFDFNIVPDRHIMLEDGSIISIKIYKNQPLWKFNYLIIGGGGIFNLERMKDDNAIFFYYNYCLSNNIKYFIVSVGFQDIEISTPIDEFRKKFIKYSDILNNSSFTSMRSVSDYTFAKSISNSYITYHPDLVYSISPTTKPIHRNIILVIISRFININYKIIRKDIRSFMEEYDDMEIVFMNWDGFNTKNDDFINDYKKNINKYFNKSSYKFYRGKMLESFLLGTSPTELNPLLFDDIIERTHSISDIFHLLSKTHIMITGRYHGIVLGKVMNIPHIITYDQNVYKFNADKLSHHNSMDNDYLKKLALKPLEIILDMIKNNRYTSGWSEDDRNNHIVQLHRRSGIDIPILQNWTNYQIMNYD